MKIYNLIHNLNAKVNKLKNTRYLKFQRTIAASEHINNITDTGFYIIGYNPPGGVASTYANSYLYVINNDHDTPYFVHQFIIKPNDGVLLMREYSGYPTRSWGAWKKATISNL